ncbi:unnamed protein product [Cuscuta campestris]|uniref:Uncharacterized protein n=1 Tax=Cuscuta campestris TaxID=132261 RepID=A0A484MRM4_9ASTE|nr:unnamed protein product [Cuscuta campestris]
MRIYKDLRTPSGRGPCKEWNLVQALCKSYAATPNSIFTAVQKEIFSLQLCTSVGHGHKIRLYIAYYGPQHSWNLENAIKVVVK